MTHIPLEIWQNAYTYADYRTMVDTLRAEGKTTGENHSEAMLAYHDLNQSRMNRLDKRARLTEATLDFLPKINKPLLVLTITEAWCGDAAQIVPVIEKMAGQNPNIQQKLILRDEHLDIIDAFLTNGGRSIPKFIFLNPDTLEVLGDWGPRPAEVQKMVMDAKYLSQKTEDATEKKAINDKVKHDIHLWYAKDKTKKIQTEFLEQVSKVIKFCQSRVE